jgi:hypothetical protein
MSIDLNVCVPGQFLRSVHGRLLIYVARRTAGAPYNHEIKFADGRGGGTRLDDGRVFANNRQDVDEDVAEILPNGWEKLHVTKEGVEVKVDQVWRDCDKRMNGRCVKVVEVSNGKALVQSYSKIGGAGGTKRRISIARMHRHSTGWVLVKGPEI